MLSSALLGVVAQRMVRRLCSKCPTPTDPHPQEMDARETEIDREGKSPDSVPSAQGRGCSYCAYTGYHGRTGVFEIMVLSDALRHLICSPSTTSAEVRAQAIKEGMITMKQDGMAKVRAGITNVSEVMANVLSTAPGD